MVAHSSKLSSSTDIALGPRKLSHLRLFPLLEDGPHPVIVCYRGSMAWLPCLSLDLLWSIIPKTKSLMESVEAFAVTVLQLTFSLCQPCWLYFLPRTVPKTTLQWTTCMWISVSQSVSLTPNLRYMMPGETEKAESNVGFWSLSTC